MSYPKYSVKDIDDLRTAWSNKVNFGVFDMRHPHRRYGGSWNPGEESAVVEDKVRTSMLAGHYAQDLYDSEN